VLKAWRQPTVNWKRRADPLERMLQCALLLDSGEVLLERGAEGVEQVD